MIRDMRPRGNSEKEIKLFKQNTQQAIANSNPNSVNNSRK